MTFLLSIERPLLIWEPELSEIKGISTFQIISSNTLAQGSLHFGFREVNNFWKINIIDVLTVKSIQLRSNESNVKNFFFLFIICAIYKCFHG